MVEDVGGAGAARMACAGVATALLLLATPAVAEPTPAQASAIRSACRSDYRANCADVPTGGSAALACLQTNFAILSAACQKVVKAASGADAPAAAPVSTPASTPAATAPAPAPPAAAQAPAAAAPAAPHPQLSLREELMLIRRACGPDYRALCAGARPGQGRAVACLRANQASLSPACQSALIGAPR